MTEGIAGLDLDKNHFSPSELRAITRFLLAVSDNGVITKLCAAYSRQLGFNATELVSTAVNDLVEICEIEEGTVESPEVVYMAVHSMSVLMGIVSDSADAALKNHTSLPDGLLNKCYNFYGTALQTIAQASADRVLAKGSDQD